MDPVCEQAFGPAVTLTKRILIRRESYGGSRSSFVEPSIVFLQAASHLIRLTSTLQLGERCLHESCSKILPGLVGER
jgi:hypothetical protein